MGSEEWFATSPEEIRAFVDSVRAEHALGPVEGRLLEGCAIIDHLLAATPPGKEEYRWRMWGTEEWFGPAYLTQAQLDAVNCETQVRTVHETEWVTIKDLP